ANGAGTYRVTCNIVVTTAATTSSTLPLCAVTWTDPDANAAGTPNGFTNTNTANVVGAGPSQPTAGGGEAILNAKAGTNINYLTSGYVSSGVTAMQYAVHFKLEYL